eukprot:CAMPEP_0198148530 /NCGR_PEP_ID=MMETSP1443-20131203/41797_1 /TAXON_ID=186043 /ORGANISM="Entomoneis sp., Strain CCMP2396" /LENGTH=272 /DNA_ID=CAMNT_0043813233 /DNA_START=70 /DNA_END=888 /DNA_ORIENTATION=-
MVFSSASLAREKDDTNSNRSTTTDDSNNGGDGNNDNDDPTTTTTRIQNSSSLKKDDNNNNNTLAPFNSNNMLAPFNPSNEHTQRVALELFSLGRPFVVSDVADDDKNVSQQAPVLFDLGCGDARLLIQAVSEYDHLQCVGLELDPTFVNRAREKCATILAPVVQNRIYIRQCDLTDPATWQSRKEQKAHDDDSSHNQNHLTLMDDATCIYICLLPDGIAKIMPYLNKLVADRQTKNKQLEVIASIFQIREWEPVRVEVTSKSGVIKTFLYKF